MSHSAVVGLATQLELEWPPVLDGVLGGLGTAAAPVGGLISMECTLKDVLPATSVVFSSTLLVIADSVRVTVRTTAPVAIIAGGDRTHRVDLELLLDGSGSYHPDHAPSAQPALESKWACAATAVAGGAASTATGGAVAVASGEGSATSGGSVSIRSASGGTGGAIGLLGESRIMRSSCGA